ncbi:MAG TPA: glutathione ABC transporter ATP-binding protein, partial [Galbitalea sp.]|nr:glutathione ABC transporter ATP-binding protein [Galbitalea sp.]
MTPAQTPTKTQAPTRNTAGNPILEVRDLGVDFWVDGTWYPAAIGMNYDVQPGEVLAIVGESGSGK